MTWANRSGQHHCGRKLLRVAPFNGEGGGGFVCVNTQTAISIKA